MKKETYFTPQVEVMEFVPGGITMISGLDDYNDNPIFGSPAPEPDSIEGII